MGLLEDQRPILGPDDTLTFPSRTKMLDYEGECAIILGKSGRNIAAAQAATSTGASPCSSTGASATTTARRGR